MASVKTWSDGHHTISVYHGMKKGANGKLKQDFDHVPFNGTRAEAEVEAERLERQKKAGRCIKSFKPLLEKWLEARKKDVETDRGLTQGSYETYCFHVKRLIPAIGDMQLQNATARQLMEALDEALADLSSKYQSGIYISLRSVIRYAAGERLMLDISSGVKAPAVRPKSEKKVVPKADIPLVLQSLEHTKWYLLFRLLIIFGLRISEGMALTWSCVDFAGGTIRILDAVNVQHRTLNNGTKTAAARRGEPLDPATLRLMKEHLEKQKKRPTPVMGQNLIFRTDDGRPLHYGSLCRSLYRALKKAYFDRYTPHEFRHTFVTQLKHAGLDEQAVQDAAGHTCRQSSQPYSHSLRQGLNLLTELHLDDSLDEHVVDTAKASNVGISD